MHDASSKSRVSTTIFAMVLLVFSWLWLQWTHELGHIIAGLCTGTQLDRVVLDPRSFSMTYFTGNPLPLLTVWGGPLIGSVLGAGIPFVVSIWLTKWRWCNRLIAAFVLIGNGAYIGLGLVDPVGDAKVMHHLGTPGWVMLIFGLLCVLIARQLVRSAFQSLTRWATWFQIGLFATLTVCMGTMGVLFFSR